MTQSTSGNVLRGVAGITTVLSIVATLVITGCSSQSGPLTTASYTGLHQHFVVWFPTKPHKLGPFTGHSDTSNVTGVEDWNAGRLSGGVSVKVVSLRQGMTKAQIGPFLRRFLPTRAGGSLGSRSGMPEIEQVVRCSTPSGRCAGLIANLTLLDGSFVYSIQSTGYDHSMSQRILDSFQPGTAS